MGTIYFLIIIGLLAFVVVWVTRKPSADLGRSKSANQSPEKLMPASHDRLSHKEEVWAARREQVRKDFSRPKQFIPKSSAKAEREYDGYSRRDRHHLTPAGQVADEPHVE